MEAKYRSLCPWAGVGASLAEAAGAVGATGRGGEKGGINAGPKGDLGGSRSPPSNSPPLLCTFLEEGFGLLAWPGLPQRRRIRVCPRILALCAGLPEILKAKAEEFEAFMT